MTSPEPAPPQRRRFARTARVLNFACAGWMIVAVLICLLFHRPNVLLPVILFGAALGTAGVVFTVAATRRRETTARAVALWTGLAGLAVVGAAVAFVRLVDWGQASYHERTRERCRENLQAVYQAVQSYRAAHDGQYPPNLAHLVQAGLLNAERLRCPSTSATFQEPNGSYNYFPGPYPANLPGPQVLAQDRGMNHQRFEDRQRVEEGRNILYDTGLIQWQTPPVRR